ncbi:MAG: cytochrome c biogenesis protein CcsA [Schwartzia sp. (in: firmicutes)]
MAGEIALWTALLFALGGVLGGWFPGASYRRLATAAAFLSFFGALTASGALLFFILTDRFDIAYVANYSAKELPLLYKVSAFWAGQAGSFLLWLFIHALTGCVLARKKDLSPFGFAVYMALQAVLALFVMGQSPFLSAETAATNGIGLNPLLQDPWMAVHPPLVFIGYALLAVPFCYSVGSLLDRPEDAAWLESARRWGLAAWGFLGAGIFVGGYWAYKVLGWGGYWGWDPVENSSLVPWLIAGVFLHVLRVARVRRAALSVTHLAAIFAFSLALYGTFLTRSGILGDFSVHSFSGTSLSLSLAAVTGIVTTAALLLLLVRGKRLPEGALYPAHDSREFFLLLGALLLVFVSVIVFLGMSMPLLTQLVGAPAAVDTNFYVRTTLPLAVAIAAVMGVGVLRRYGAGGVPLAKGALIAAFLLGIAAALLVGVRSLLSLLLSGAAVLAVAGTGIAGKEKRLGFGGAIAHLGAALALLAMVLAESGGAQVSHTFTVDEPAPLLGHTIVYRGQRFMADGTGKAYVYTVDGREVTAFTKLHPSGEDAAREPAIDKTLSGDVYIAPAPPQESGRAELVLARHRTVMDDGFAYRYEDMEVTPQPDGGFLVAVDVAVTDGAAVEHVHPAITATAEGGASKPVPFFGGERRLRLTGVSEDSRHIRLELLPSEEEEAARPIAATVSTKPFIWLLWLGALLVTLGSFVAAGKA